MKGSLEWGCLRKRPYPFHWNAVVRCVRAYRELGVRLFPYECAHCHMWHVADADKKGSRTAEAALGRMDDGSDPWAVSMEASK